MLDEEIKKLLNEIKMNESEQHSEAVEQDFASGQNRPIQHLEQQYNKKNASKPHSGRSKVLLAIACAVLAPAGYMAWQTPENQASSYIAYNDQTDEDEKNAQIEEPPAPSLEQDREALAASWAKQIVDINVEEGQNVQVLWDMLRRRREDLEGTTRELSELLTNNAKHRQDFYAQTASVLLSRYQAIDARYSVEVANQINAIYAQIQEAQNPDLARAYAEMLGELGAESYSTHQIQIAKQLLQHEAMCQKALLNIEASNSLPELDYNLRLAKQVVEVIKTNGLLQTFHEGQEYQNQMVQACKETLNKMLDNENQSFFAADSQELVEGMLADLGVEADEIQAYMDKLNASSEGEESQPANSSANC